MSNYIEKTLKKVEKLEEKYKTNGYKGNPEISYEINRYGFCPVIISAPHSVKHIRNGNIKAHEFYTGAMAEYLAEMLGCTYITKLGLMEGNGDDDPNHDPSDCGYKKAIAEYLKDNECKLFIDLHGLSCSKDTIIDICTDEGKNTLDAVFPNDLREAVEGEFGDGTVSMNKFYKAHDQNILSKWVSDTYGIPAAELEINGKYRWFHDGDIENSVKFLETLYKAIELWTTHAAK